MIKNQIFKTAVTDMNNLGYGVCRIEDMVVFVDGAVDGDFAEIRIIKTARDYCVGRIERIIEPSHHRIEPDCGVFSRPIASRCGGCVFRHISYEHELELKRSFVASSFRKAGIEAEVLPVLTAGNISDYRNKAEYPVSSFGETGFYARRTHDIIPCESCSLGPFEFDGIAQIFRNWFRKTKPSGIRHLYLRRAFGTGEIMVCIVSSSRRLPESESLILELRAEFPEIKSVVLNVNPDDTNVILGKECITLFGSNTIEDVLRGMRFRISPLSFYQVNHDGAELLYGEAIKRIRNTNARRVADLYCGAGTIGICAANEIPDISLTGVEIIHDAVENACINAKLNNIKNARFICQDAAAADISGYGCVIVDPPRKGMAPELVSRLIECSPEHIVYVSCNSDTLARDARALVLGGYKMSSVTPVDMFPRTGSVESVVLLCREETK